MSYANDNSVISRDYGAASDRKPVFSTKNPGSPRTQGGTSVADSYGHESGPIINPAAK